MISCMTSRPIQVQTSSMADVLWRPSLPPKALNSQKYLRSSLSGAMALLRGKFSNVLIFLPTFSSVNVQHLQQLRLTCIHSPGRFHASLVMKMILSHFVSSYDMRFEDEKARRKWSWETFTMPYESTRILLTKRDAWRGVPRAYFRSRKCSEEKKKEIEG